MRTILAFSLALLLASPAFAAFQGGGSAPAPGATSAQPGGFKGPGAKPVVDTVAKALKAGDDSPCVIEGRIISAGPEHEEYVFQDATGKIVIEIDDDLFQGRTVTPENTIRIYGEVDSKLARDSEIDVDRFDIL